MKKNNKIKNIIIDCTIALREEFCKKHNLKNNQDSNIKYGRSISLSSFFETTFANELANSFPKLHFLVDYPITLRTAKNNFLTTLYYDILVVKKLNKGNQLDKGEIIGIIDLKIDLGYIDENYYGFQKGWKYSKAPKINKDYPFKNREEVFKNSKNISCNKIVNRDTESSENEKIELKKSTKLIKVSIVATKNNDHGRSNQYEKMMIKNGYNVIFVLEKNHPNKNSKENIETQIKADINQKAKSEILNKIKF